SSSSSRSLPATTSATTTSSSSSISTTSSSPSSSFSIVSSTSTSSRTTFSTVTTTSTSATSIITGTTISGYVYQGCFTDPRPSPNPLTQILTISSMNREVCASAAAAHSKSYSVWGVEYYSECWAGYQTLTYTSLTKGCTDTCAGNKSEMCGGPLQLNLF